jgi:flagellum-specific ATP synthase
MAAYRDKQDLIAIGAYQSGADPLTDAAIVARDHIEGFLKQSVEEISSAEDADEGLAALAALGAAVQQPVPADPGMAAAPAAASAPQVPLHSAIPPLHLAA